MRQKAWRRLGEQFWVLLVGICVAGYAQSAPPKMSIYHFDVNTGDATLIVSPDGRAVLIDAGNTGRGKNPIVEFLNRARTSGAVASIDFTIATHYDADHIGGMDEVFANGWIPTVAALDRGDFLLPPFNRDYVAASCNDVDPDEAEGIAQWGTPSAFCPMSRHASCGIIEYFLTAKAGDKRKTAEPGQTLELDHGIKLTIVVANAKDADGNSVDLDFPGRRDDCASNDLSVGVLVSFGDFHYFVGGDLTGMPSEGVADVESLLIGNIEKLDIYHVSHHGAATSSSPAFMAAIHPKVAIVSNGRQFGHPRKTVVEDQILSLNPPPTMFLTNLNHNDDAWNEDPDAIADVDYEGFDGMIEVAVFQRSYRVYRWRNGNRMDGGARFLIRQRP